MYLLNSITFTYDFLPVLIVMGIAWLIPMFLSLVGVKKVPTVIIEILAGYFIGKSLFTFFPAESIKSLEFLALSGFLFLMFHSGLEIDVNKILDTFPRKRITWSTFIQNPLLVGVLMFAITLGLSYVASLLLNNLVPIQNKWYFSLIIVTTSVGIIVPVLKNRGELRTHFGQMVLLAAALADLLSILLFTFSAYIIRHGFRLELLLIFILFVVFLLFRRIGEKLTQVTLFKRLIYQLAYATSQIQIRGTILLILIFVVLAQYLGEEVMLLGAFLSGLLLSSFIHKSRSVLLIQLDGMGYGFFIPFFFIMVGAQFNPSHLLEFDDSLVYFLVILLLVLFLVKIIPSLLWMRFFRFREVLSGGILMASRLSLIIAASKIGVDLNIISPGINACFIIMAVVTCLLSPILYNHLNPPKSGQFNKVLIVGGSSTGVLLQRRLKIYELHSLIIEKDPERLNEMKDKGLDVYYGDGKDPELYKDVGLQKSDFVVVMTGNDMENFHICKLINEQLGHDNTISYASNSRFERKLTSLEVHSLDINRIKANTIENYILRPTTYHALIESFENYTIEETEVRNNQVDGKAVKNIPFHKDSYLMLIKRGDMMEIPHGESYLKKGDTVLVFGTDTALIDTRNRLS